LINGAVAGLLLCWFDAGYLTEREKEKERKRGTLGEKVL